MYIIKTMSGEKFKISFKSFQLLKEKKEGLIYIPEVDSTVNISSISAIYPESEKKKIEGKKDQKEGFLHDGTRVVKKFGEWVKAGEATPDDKGNYQPIKLDRGYYPEVAADCVADEDEWEKVKEGNDYYQVMGYEPRKNKELNKGEFTHLLN